ncbi:hypothetical protein [Microlunatus antarcticus]|uniref:Uncharacterized protein n=1 Tax=Microlunatus antarcticus TaxID=53388 RepID=A0A7W5JV85_9ACTN|nr:hypothetical protein [Microlunatus antarcticus]MBB3326868.1 hypothetical protein [Microlunatus antarcticus]
MPVLLGPYGAWLLGWSSLSGPAGFAPFVAAVVVLALSEGRLGLKDLAGAAIVLTVVWQAGENSVAALRA